MQKVLLLIFMVAAMFFVVSCGDDSEDEINSAIGGSCSLEGEKQCSGDSSQILVCNNSFWKAQTTCNLNFGQYCRQLENGEFSCTDSSNGGDKGNGGNTDNGGNNGGSDDNGNGGNNDSGDSGSDEGDSQPDGDDTDTSDSGDSQPDGGDTDTSDSGDSQPDSGDTDTSDSGDSGTCSDCDGTGVKITGTVTLFHPTAIPSQTYSGLGGVQDASGNWPPCETSVTLGDKSVYGTLTVNINTKHIATHEEIKALTQITGTESFIQVNHSVTGTMGAASYPKYSTGITMNYFKTSTNSETGETETDLFIDDMDLINGNISDTYAVRMFCEGSTVESGVKTIGPYTSNDCIFYVLNFATDSTDACWYALGVSDPDLVNNGLTFTVQ